LFAKEQTMATNSTKEHLKAKEALKKACKKEIDAIVVCKKKNATTFRDDCQTVAIYLASCAADNFCPEQHKEMKQACSTEKGGSGSGPCITAKMHLDQCFKERGFPISDHL
jgi:hypothetical protein